MSSVTKPVGDFGKKTGEWFEKGAKDSLATYKKYSPEMGIYRILTGKGYVEDSGNKKGRKPGRSTQSPGRTVLSDTGYNDQI